MRRAGAQYFNKAVPPSLFPSLGAGKTLLGSKLSLVFNLVLGASLGQAQQPAEMPLAFEVASVKPTDANTGPFGMFTYPGGRLTITQQTLKTIIQEAYGVNRFQVSGGPNWLDEDRYDIVAKPPASSESSKFSPPTIKTPPTREMLLMLQALLADRFQLRLHRETKDGPAYALMVAAKGPKLTPTKNPDAFRYVGGGVTTDPQLPLFMSGENASMEMLALRLSDRFGRPVLDQTALKGDFDFEFKYENDDPQPGAPSNFRTLISAMQEQLGLRLVQTKAPVEILVIDHAEKPSLN
jgi:uncharacterized protein (TIGR03435 family)